MASPVCEVLRFELVDGAVIRMARRLYLLTKCYKRVAFRCNPQNAAPPLRCGSRCRKPARVIG